MKIRDFYQNIFPKIQPMTDKISEFLPREKRRIFLYITGGLVLAAICLTIISLIIAIKKPETQIKLSGSPIPAEELFYPAEPDFLPRLLLDHEPRRRWTANDIKPFWKDPGPGHEAQWREAAISVIDKLMEGVR